MPSIPELQSRWNHLYKVHLPSLAKARDPVQAHWPVQLDHCFARIILDNAVGNGQPWAKTIKSPAYKNMTQAQLEDAIDLGERLATGQEDLVGLDERSLQMRGKQSKQAKSIASPKRKLPVTNVSPSKKTKTDGTISSHFAPQRAIEHTSSPSMTGSVSPTVSNKAPPSPSPTPPTLTDPITGKPCPSLPPVDLIKQSSLTPFRKQVLLLLTQVPRGQWTSYAAMAAHVSATSHQTCARAVGSAMRNNPFAPAVPCHRVLASDGRIGGFGGEWGDEGKHAAKKKSMLREEGVKFDGKGIVVGKPWTGRQGDGKA